MFSPYIVAVAVGSGAWWAFKGESYGDWAAAKEEVSKKKMKEKMIKHTRRKNHLYPLGVGVMNGWYPNPNLVPRWVPCPLKD